VYKRVLFCVPTFPGKEDPPIAPHSGIGYLSEFLKKHDIETNIIDLNLGYDESDLLSKAREFKPDLVGFTAMSYQQSIVYRLVDKLKEEGYTVVIGGPHVSTIRSKALEECNADFAIKHEGEYTLLELCEGRDFDKMDGLIYRKDKEIIENKDRPFIENLDDIPFPTYEKFELEKYDLRKEREDKTLFVVSSRGCPYRCTFCTVQVSMGRRFRARSAENIVEELEYWYKNGYRTFDFSDDNFTFDKERVLEICDLIEKRGLTDLYLKCGNGVRADKTDRELLARMKKVGFVELSFGVESGSNKVLKNIKKTVKVEVIEEAIKTACELGFKICLFFMIGLPGATRLDEEKSIQLALKYPIEEARFYNVVPLPRTELYEWVYKNNYFVADPIAFFNDSSVWDIEPVYQTPEFTIEGRRKMLAKGKKIRQKILKRARHRRMIKRFGVIGHIIYLFIQVDVLYEMAIRIDNVMKSKLS